MRQKNVLLEIVFTFFSCGMMTFTACNLQANELNLPASFKVKANDSKIYNDKDSCKKSLEALSSFAIKNNCNENLFFVIDLEEHSGKKRFFVFDKKQDSVMAMGMVAQGQGKILTAKPTYSNIPGSYCSSRGMYIIGEAYNGIFGLAYKLYGKDATNSNAFSRFVVLHAHSCVPDSEVYPSHICQSQGCPTVSPSFLKTLSTYIQTSKQPIVLVIK